jgi:hypothetical protein
LSSNSLSKNYKIRICKSIILLVLYECGTWSLTLREEHRLRVFENRVLRISRPKREEVAGSWQRLHNEVLHNLYTSPNIIRMIKSRCIGWAGHIACMGKMKNEYQNLSENLKGRDHLEDLGVDGWKY